MSSRENIPMLDRPKWDTPKDASAEPLFDSRVFIPLSKNSACHAGCSYCYIPNKNTTPTPVGETELTEWLHEITEHELFTDRTLVSLGCVDDPFASELTSNTITALDYFHGRHPTVATQLASKFVLPPAVEEYMAGKDYSGSLSPSLSVSLTFLRRSIAEKLERGTANPEDRAKNILRAKKMGWGTIALLKPFLPGMESDDSIRQYIRLFSETEPNVVAVGRHDIKGNRPQAKTHPVATNWSEALKDRDRRELFIERVHEALPHLVIRNSAISATAYLRDEKMRFKPETTGR